MVMMMFTCDNVGHDDDDDEKYFRTNMRSV
jgi:hypothetical protein